MNRVIFPLLQFINRNFAVGKNIYLSQKGKISFISSPPLHDSEVASNEVASLLNTRTGDFNFASLLNTFYHSLAEPGGLALNTGSRGWLKSIFKGSIAGNSLAGIDFYTDGCYPVEVKGDLIIQEISKKVYTTGSILIDRGMIRAQSVIRFHSYEFNLDKSHRAGSLDAQDFEMRIELAFESKGNG
jgi:hypothetical protein